MCSPSTSYQAPSIALACIPLRRCAVSHAVAVALKAAIRFYAQVFVDQNVTIIYVDWDWSKTLGCPFVDQHLQ